MHIKKSFFIFLALSLIYTILVIIYYSALIGDKDKLFSVNDYWYPTIYKHFNMFSRGKDIFGFESINPILPDSLFYQSFDNFQDIIQFQIISGRGIMSTISGISLMGIVISKFSSFLVFNIFLVTLTAYNLTKLCTLFEISNTKVLYFLFFLPFTLCFSQTLTKEIFLLFLISNFFYYYIKQKYFWCILIIVFATILRPFIGIGMLIYWFALPIQFKYKGLTNIFIFCTFLLLPIVTSYYSNDAHLNYFENTEVTGLANILNTILLKVPLAAYLILPLRFFQNLIDNISLNAYLIFDNKINIYLFVVCNSAIIAFLLITNYVLLFIDFLFYSKKKFTNESLTTKFEAYLFLMVIITSSNAFIQLRYYYPLLPLIFLLNSLKKSPLTHPILQKLNNTFYKIRFVLLFLIFIYGTYK